MGQHNDNFRLPINSKPSLQLANLGLFQNDTGKKVNLSSERSDRAKPRSDPPSCIVIMACVTLIAGLQGPTQINWQGASVFKASGADFSNTLMAHCDAYCTCPWTGH
jgi:hypothetical protein